MAFSGSCDRPITNMLKPTTDKGRLKKFISGLKASGSTPLGPAILAAGRFLHQGKAASSRAAMVILLADGQDSCGAVEQSLATLQAAGIQMAYQTVALDVATGSKAARQLRRVATSTGGQYHHAADVQALTRVFDQIAHVVDQMHIIGRFLGKSEPSPPERNSTQDPKAGGIQGRSRLWKLLK